MAAPDPVKVNRIFSSAPLAESARGLVINAEASSREHAHLAFRQDACL